MAERNPRKHNLNDDVQPADDDIWSEEELERAHTGWSANDELDVEIEAEDDFDDDETLLYEADDALNEMAAREMRRDQSYRTGGDDENPGFDSGIDSNAPKRDDMPDKKRGGSRGRSDWH